MCNDAIERRFLAPPEEDEQIDFIEFDQNPQVQVNQEEQDQLAQIIAERVEDFITSDLLTQEELDEQAHLLLLYQIVQEEQVQPRDVWDGEITVVDHRVDDQDSQGESSDDEDLPQENEEVLDVGEELVSNEVPVGQIMDDQNLQCESSDDEEVLSNFVADANEVPVVKTTTDQATQTDASMRTDVEMTDNDDN
jgi:hypothetical protein